MEENKEKILDRIAKLLTLAEDQKDKPEGDTARKLASKLMAKYRIAESEVDLSNKNSSDIVEDGQGWVGLNDEGGKRQWVADLGGYIAKTFDCKLWMSCWEGTIHFVGTEGDVETCLYFMDVVFGHVERESRKILPKPEQWKKRNIFGQAAVYEISIRLYEMEKNMKQEMKEHYSGGYDLMVVKGDLVTKAYADIYKERGLGRGKRKDIKMSSNANRGIVMAGAMAGKTAPLNKALN
jgi:hypothetical protein